MEIKSVAVIGAGAIGSYFLDGLSNKLKENIWAVAEGARKKRLETAGLIINGVQLFPKVKTPEESKGVDLLIVIVKYTALQSTLPMIEKIIDEHTLVMSPLNGVDSEQIVGEKIGEKHIVHALMKISIERRGNRIKYNPESGRGIFFGEEDGSISERIAAINALFNGTPIHHQIRKNILQDKWYKFALNISNNLPQAILNCGFGAYTASEHVKYISKMMRAEVVAVASAKGIDISDETNPAGIPSKVLPNARFSTLQDLDAKRETEIETFSGALVRMAKKLNVPVPFNDFAYHAIKAIEEKNAGLIS